MILHQFDSIISESRDLTGWNLTFKV